MEHEQSPPPWQETIPFINHLLSTAIESKAQAIHLEPRQDKLEVRLRSFGALGPAQELPRAAIRPIIDRVKAMSCLDLNERRLPQDGRIRLSINEQPVDLRLSISPLYWGEKAVLKLLPSAHNRQSLADLGMHENEASEIRRMFTGGRGLLLVFGPAGSGVSTTLCTMASMLATGSNQVLFIGHASLSDVSGLSQLTPRPWIGLTTAACLRTATRADCDAIVVDELDSDETADVAISEAKRGSLIVSSHPAGSASEGIARLLDLGVTGHSLASSLRLVLCQRLIPMNCPECREESTPVDDELRDLLARHGCGEQLSTSPLFTTRGCPSCHGTGRAGWLPFFETFAIDQAFGDVLRGTASRRTLSRFLFETGQRRLHREVWAAACRGEISRESLEGILAAD